MIGVIDYGMGNIHSVQKALEAFKKDRVQIVNNPAELKACGKLVLPGVGAFDDAVRELRKQGLITALKEQLQKKKIFLGICLGMQLLFRESQEAKQEKGLGILSGKVKKFKQTNRQKVPQMGWNQLKIVARQCPLLKGIPDDSFVYFCHSYYPQPQDQAVIAAITDYGINFASVVYEDNIFGVQFHPEKSQSVGLKMLKNFIEL